MSWGIHEIKHKMHLNNIIYIAILYNISLVNKLLADKVKFSLHFPLHQQSQKVLNYFVMLGLP